MLCSKCGAEMESSDSFCPSCGNPREEVAEPVSCDIEINSDEITEEDKKRAEVLYNLQPPVAIPEYKPTEVKKKHFPIKIVGVVSIFILIAGFLGYLALYTNFFVSDETLIKERLDVFVAAINEGDMEKIESCLDKAKKDASGSVLEEEKAILEGILNFGDFIEKIPGVNIPPDEKYNVKVDKIRDISINGDTAEVTADVKLKLAVLPEKDIIAKVTLTKEKEGAFTHNWYISDVAAEEKEEGVEL